MPKPALPPSPINESLAWQHLQHHAHTTEFNLRQMFQTDPLRAERYSLTLGPVFLDFSKNYLLPETLTLLHNLAIEANLPERIQAMFQGEAINITEHRAVLHTALRADPPTTVEIDHKPIGPKITAVLQQMRQFTEAVRTGQWRGTTGKTITDVVNIGIGGSDLGPVMVTEALKPYQSATLKVHFVSNIDGTAIDNTLKLLNPETTLFIIASKTFTTQETLTNATTAKAWLLHNLPQAVIAQHFVALSTNIQAASEFGIDPHNCFEFWDWVGGRYSLWSAVGLSIALAIGMDRFMELLAGAREMDQHFRTAPLLHNMPVILGLLGIWYNNFYHAHSQAIIPYDQSLHRFPAYLQQADMESNGKQTTLAGHKTAYQTGAVVWGEPGTNGQHAFFQLLHQGTALIPVDFILPLQPHHPLTHHHQILAANCFAQSEALMRGKTEREAQQELHAQGLPAEEIAALLPHKIFPGNRPSNTILLTQLTPASLGALIALYEHKIFVQGVIWNVNSFDQWGVELGKQLAKPILAEIRGQDTPQAAPALPHDGSTLQLIQHFRQQINTI